MKRVIIIRSNGIAPDPRVEKMMQFLSGKKVEVTVYGWDRQNNLPQKELRYGGKIIRFAGWSEKGRKWVHRLNMIRWFGFLFWRALTKPYDVIHACDFETFFPSYLAVRLRGKRIVYDIFDYYADIIIGVPMWLRERVMKIDMSMMPKADLLIIADKVRYEQVKGDRVKNIQIFYNTPPDLLPSFKKRAFDKPNRFRVVYLGLIDNRKRDLRFIIDAFKEIPQAELVIFGGGKDRKTIEAYADSLDNVSVNDKIGFTDALFEEYKGNAILAVYDPAIPNNVLASPNKLFEAMMLERPIMMNKEVKNASYIYDYNCGITFDFDNKDSFKSALQHLMDNPEETYAMGLAGRAIYESTFNFNALAEELWSKYPINE